MRYIVEQSKNPITGKVNTWVMTSSPIRRRYNSSTKNEYQIIYPPSWTEKEDSWDEIGTPAPNWTVKVTKHYDTFDDFMADHIDMFL